MIRCLDTAIFSHRGISSVDVQTPDTDDSFGRSILRQCLIGKNSVCFIIACR